jgi:hypothetical protein
MERETQHGYYVNQKITDMLIIRYPCTFYFTKFLLLIKMRIEPAHPIRRIKLFKLKFVSVFLCSKDAISLLKELLS